MEWRPEGQLGPAQLCPAVSQLAPSMGAVLQWKQKHDSIKLASLAGTVDKGCTNCNCTYGTDFRWLYATKLLP